MRRAIAVGLAWFASAVGAGPATGQTLDQIRAFMNDGGAWLSLDIVDGRGRYTGPVVPTMGMDFQGWFQVADVHRGEWTIRVQDLAAKGRSSPVLQVTARPGQQIPVAYAPGMTAQAQVDVQWSEAADTVLWVWVGLQDRQGPGRDP